MPQRQEISIKFSFWGTSLTQAVGKTNSDFFVCFFIYSHFLRKLCTELTKGHEQSQVSNMLAISHT